MDQQQPRPASKRGRARKKSAGSSFSPLALQEGGRDDFAFDFDEQPQQTQQTKLMRRKAGTKIEIPALKPSNAPSAVHNNNGGVRRVERPLQTALREQEEQRISPGAYRNSRRSSLKPATVYQSSKTKKGNHKDTTTISMKEKMLKYTGNPVSYKNKNNNARKRMSVKMASYHRENGGGSRAMPMKMDSLATTGVRAWNPPVTTSTSSTTHYDPLGNALNQKIVDLVEDDDHDPQEEEEAHAQEQQSLSTKKKKKKGPSPSTLSISSGVSSSSSSSDSDDASEKDHAATAAASPNVQPSYMDTLQQQHQSRRRQSRRQRRRGRQEDVAMASPPIPRKPKISSEAASSTSVSELNGREQKPASRTHSLPQPPQEEDESSLLDRRQYHRHKTSNVPIPSFQVTATALAAASPTKSQPQVGTSPQTSIAIHDDDDGDDVDYDGYTATSGSGHKKRRSPQEQETTTTLVQDEDNNIPDDYPPRSRISTFVKNVGQRVMQHMTPSQSRKKPKVTTTTHKYFAPEPTEELPLDLKPSSRSSSSKLVGLPRKHPAKKHSNDDYDYDDSSEDDFCVQTSAAASTTERDKSYELRDTIEAMGEPSTTGSSSSWGGGRIPRKLKPNNSPSSSLFSLTKANNHKNDPSPNLRNNSGSTKRKPKGNPIGKPGGTFRKPSNNKDLDLPWRSDDDDDEYYSSSSKKRRSYDSWSSVTPRRRSTRHQTMLSSSSKKKVKSPEVVDMCDSDSDEDVVEVARPEVQPINLELTRIAIGKTVYFAECEASLDPNSLDLTLFYKKTRRKTYARTRSDDSRALGTNVLALTDGSLNGLFIYDGPEEASPAGALLVDTDDEESTEHKIGTEHQFGPLIALHIKATPENKLAAFTRSLIPDGDDDKAKYVVLELRDKEVLDIVKPLLIALKEVKKVSIVQGSEGQLFKYAASLTLDNTRRLKATKRNAFLDGRPSDYALLVYPFAGDPKQMEDAAAGLTEAAGSYATSGVVATSKQGSSENKDGEGKSRHRAHFVSITVEDYERLEPGEWLNDSLVDFWMQWISRDNTTLDSPFHFFTSHFYSRLAAEGPDSVVGWTRRKKINIFEKKLIFIPINKSLHWSLCVVVNPGALLLRMGQESTKEDPLSCMIFMDSLRMHNKSTVANHIRKWLNSEYKRIEKDLTEAASPIVKKDFFANSNLPIFSPNVPMQDNSHDCGVFVCRYAYAIYELRSREFTFGDAGMHCGEDDLAAGSSRRNAFKELISDGVEFDFNMDDIARFREEFKTLVENLSRLYVKSKSAEPAVQAEDEDVADQTLSAKAATLVDSDDDVDEAPRSISSTEKENREDNAIALNSTKDVESLSQSSRKDLTADL